MLASISYAETSPVYVLLDQSSRVRAALWVVALTFEWLEPNKFVVVEGMMQNPAYVTLSSIEAA